jgi:N6-adenosine-specific RNA methylase IME4
VPTLTRRKYQVVLADPPWRFSNRPRLKRCGGTVDIIDPIENHYPTMTTGEIRSLDVKSLADPEGCALFLWTTNAHMEQAIGVMGSWGFIYTTVAFVWIKYHSRSRNPKVLPGFWTNGCWEICLFGRTRKSPRRVSTKVHGLVTTNDTFRVHSSKPPEVYERIEELFGECRRLELFARNRRLGWDAFGDQVEGSIRIGGSRCVV